MLRILGAFLLLGSVGWLGWAAAGELSRRTALLRELVDALERMKREVAFRLTPLPALCERLGRECVQPLGSFFSVCAQRAAAGEEPFWDSWQQAGECLRGAMEPEALARLMELGRTLGRSDSDGEARLLEAAVEELRELLARSEEDARRKGRLYSSLGLTAGAFLVILLI